jgi:hypothetical protein
LTPAFFQPQSESGTEKHGKYSRFSFVLRRNMVDRQIPSLRDSLDGESRRATGSLKGEFKMESPDKGSAAEINNAFAKEPRPAERMSYELGNPTPNAVDPTAGRGVISGPEESAVSRANQPTPQSVPVGASFGKEMSVPMAVSAREVAEDAERRRNR